MADKKKIAIVVNSCIVGGVETALINMLRLMDADKFDITVFTNFDGNPIVKNVPEYVKCVDLDEYGIKTVYKHAVSTHDLKTVLTILYNYARFRLGKNAYNRNVWLYKHINFKKINYDYLIAYKFGASSIAIANEAFNAKKTLVWIHGDLPINDSEYKSALASFDKCFCVSEYMKEHFLSHCPTAREKTDVFHNIVDAEDIWNKSNEEIQDVDFSKEILIVTVGRLGTGKGQISIPQTAKMLAVSGIDFIWYIVGDGPEREAVEQEIKRLGVGKCVFLLGTKENPYPYMKACTLYVQTSTSEGWCLTTQEARVLHKPCVVTDIPVMHEQFIDGENGIIAKGTDAASLYEGIMRLINSNTLYDDIVKNLEESPQNGAVELQKLYDFFGD